MVEASSNPGRLDMVMRFQGQVYIFEFSKTKRALLHWQVETIWATPG